MPRSLTRISLKSALLASCLGAALCVPGIAVAAQPASQAPITAKSFHHLQTVHFSSSPSSSAYKIAAHYFKPFLHAHPDAHMSVGLVALQNPTVAAVAVRMNGPKMCSGGECPTAIIAYPQGAKGYTEVFSTGTKTLSVSRAKVLPGKKAHYAHAYLVVDGRVVWGWGSGSYEPLLGSVLPLETDGNNWPAASPKLASYARRLAGAPSSAYVAAFALHNVGTPISAVSVEYDCGALGCPFYLVATAQGHYRELLYTVVPASGIAISSPVSHGLKAISIQNNQGYDSYQYNGHVYTLTGANTAEK